ncbi:MAG: L-threonylcarbamoyladenylate synthase, partial [Thermodesulfobacteriota bacterium]
EIPSIAERLMSAFWPGKLTIVFHAKEGISKSLTAKTGKIGIRLPEHPVAASLVKAISVPITATSANRAGKPGVSRIADLDEEFLDRVELILDAGVLKGGAGSTVIDVTIEPPEILRLGEISEEALLAVLSSDLQSY